jgi:hypothetical protein
MRCWQSTGTRKAKAPPGGAGLSFGEAGMGIARFINRSADFGKGSKKWTGLRFRRSSPAVRTERMSEKDADAEEGKPATTISVIALQTLCPPICRKNPTLVVLPWIDRPGDARHLNADASR